MVKVLDPVPEVLGLTLARSTADGGGMIFFVAVSLDGNG
jgi:hypothetical protein